MTQSSPSAADGTTVDDRLEVGRLRRALVPRSSLADLVAPTRDPVAAVLADNVGRDADLIPVRHHRMAASAFTFYRGTAGLMAGDLAAGPSTGLTVQLCGDAHLSNFGLFATPERRLTFDLNDFDETHPGPWEWDLKRLAASVHLAAVAAGHPLMSSTATCGPRPRPIDAAWRSTPGPAPSTSGTTRWTWTRRCRR